MQESKISKNITTKELMLLDYRYNYSDDELLTDWKKLQTCKKYKKGAQFKPGMKLCQHFSRNFWYIENQKGNSFHKAWNNYEVMDKVRVWGLESMSNLWMSWIRRAIFMCAGLPNSSFYRPHFSRQIITEICKKEKGTLFDPCIGWGGRMLGTLSTDWNYIGCDPNKETYQNSIEMLNFLQNYVDTSNVKLYNIPVETFDFSSISKKVDIVLTSPPYFNLEIYNDDTTQSYNKHNTYEEWKNHWLIPLIENCLSILKDDGISSWNVMNFRKHDIVNDVLTVHKKNGWSLETTCLLYTTPSPRD